ncbi:hypothetical protein [Umezawaea beigongshangensis]|uniref:hypothetical protein n=1 Tax=Umezawaea beigongshangensis TaxID=2780383 RepID=UPI0018F24434|nr:hypothetical protein [Umezawaea beigongshangensis]
MNRSARTVLAVVLSAVALVTVGCGSAKRSSGSGPAVTGDAKKGAPKTTTKSTTSETRECDWRSEKRFAQVTGLENGTTVTLVLQAAEKRPLGEGFETEPLDVPRCSAQMTGDARVLTVAGGSSTPREFVEAVADRSASDREEGFDLTFDGSGRITEVRWSHVPTS